MEPKLKNKLTKSKFAKQMGQYRLKDPDLSTGHIIFLKTFLKSGRQMPERYLLNKIRSRASLFIVIPHNLHKLSTPVTNKWRTVSTGLI
jgi:hypothetical protein